MPRFLLAAAVTFAFALPAFAGPSNSLMDVSPDGTRLVVANADAGIVAVIDLKTRTKLFEVKVGDHPEGVSWVGDSPLAIVTVWGDDKLVFLDTLSQKTVSIAVDDEPYGIVVTKDGSRAYVTHDYPGTVVEYDVRARRAIRTIKVGECIRGIALSSDEKTIYVTEFYTAKLIAIDRESGKPGETWQGSESENFSRNVVLHPTFGTAYLPHIKSRTQGLDARGSIFAQLSVCDIGPASAKMDERRRPHTTDTFNSVLVTANAYEAAVSPDGSRLYVVYAGTDDLNLLRPTNDRYRDAEPLARPIPVGKHPRAVRTSPDGKEVYIYNTLDWDVAVYDADIRKVQAKIKVCDPPHTPEWVRGKELFVTAKMPMGSAQWISCSSCHMDGLSDKRVWQNPEGDRRTPNLFGLAHTHPLHWSADRDEVQDFEYTIRGKLMKGRGLFNGTLKQGSGFDTVALDMVLSGKSKDLDALAVYTNAYKTPMSPHAAGLGKLTPEAERGKALFFAAETKCATCHSGPYYTDSSLKKPYNLHDVGTGDSPREKMGPKYDTPTLVGIYRTGPYLHDGRASTLRDVLTTCNNGDKHGKTSHLKPAELDDLVAFLKSLPYDTLPDETPNSVPYRLKK
jgi:YVTN family beta-propeller protein